MNPTSIPQGFGKGSPAELEALRNSGPNNDLDAQADEQAAPADDDSSEGEN